MKKYETTRAVRSPGFFFSFALIAVLLAVSCGSLNVGAPKPSGPPQRIISHVPAFTEILFALGVGDRVVGVSDFCRNPEAARALPKVGGVLNPNLEAVFGLKPDLIVLMATQRELAARYETLGFRVLSMECGSIDQTFAAMATIGEAAGVPERAAELAGRVRAELDAVRTGAQGRRRPRALFVAEHQAGDLRAVYVAGPRSFNGALLQLAGGENVFADLTETYTNVGMERIVERDPEVIIVMSPRAEVSAEDEAGERLLWAPLASVSAVKTGRIHLVSSDPIAIPGPRIGEAARRLSRILQPEPGP